MSPAEPLETTVLEAPDEAPLEEIGRAMSLRVMQDPDYVTDLLNARSRAELRNPVTWAVKRLIRDHEQDEPAMYARYFGDHAFRDALLDFVQRDTYESREETRETKNRRDAAWDAYDRRIADRGGKEQSPRMYGVGDIVYMDGGAAHAIIEVGDWISYEPVGNRGSGIPVRKRNY